MKYHPRGKIRGAFPHNKMRNPWSSVYGWAIFISWEQPWDSVHSHNFHQYQTHKPAVTASRCKDILMMNMGNKSRAVKRVHIEALDDEVHKRFANMVIWAKEWSDKQQMNICHALAGSGAATVRVTRSHVCVSTQPSLRTCYCCKVDKCICVESTRYKLQTTR